LHRRKRLDALIGEVVEQADSQLVTSLVIKGMPRRR